MKNLFETFNEEYYKTNNYVNYLERDFSDQADDIIKIFDLKYYSNILDFGCALGGLLYTIKNKGCYRVTGTDISYWAIETGLEKYKLNLEHYNRNLLIDTIWDAVILLDVLEHMDYTELSIILQLLKISNGSNVILVRVPVSKNEGEDYVLECSRLDKTHIQRHCKQWWINRFTEAGFDIEYISTKTMYDSDGVLVCKLIRGKEE